MPAWIRQPTLGWLAVLIVLLLGLDHASKWLASSQLVYGQPVPVLPFLNWTLLHNEGAAFSFLSDAGGWQRWFFVGVSLVASVVFMVWITRTPASHAWMRYSLALITAGALGNLIDRVWLGYVVDFISVHWQQRYFFPAFNIADSAITVGAMLMIADMFIHPEAHQ